MARISLPIDSGHYLSDSHTLSNRQCINLYPSHPADDGAQARGALLSFPGSDLVSAEYLKPLARPIKAGGSLYFATDLKLWKLDSSENLTLAASPALTSTSTVMAYNGVVVVIVSPGGNGWFYNPITSTLTTIADAAFTAFQAEGDGIESVCFIDGRFVYSTKKSIFWGSLVTENSGQTFDALAFISPFLTENIKSVKNVQGRLIVGGDERSKMFATTGDQDLPFQEIPGATFDKGPYSETAMISFDSSFYMVGNGPDECLGVYRGSTSGGLLKISTDYIDSVLKDVTDETSSIKKMFMSGFSYRGRSFVLLSLSFTSLAKYQFLYDIQSSQTKGFPVWIRLISNYEFDSFVPLSGIGASSYSKFDFLDLLDIPYEYLIEYNDNVYSPAIGGLERLNEGKSQRGINTTHAPCLFTTPYLNDRSSGLVINRLELVMDTGTSNNADLSTQDTNIKVKMRYSDNGGNTWVDCGERGLGKYQQYDKRLVWSGLGLCRTDRLFEFSCTHDSSIKFVRVDLEVEGTARNL